jgi:YfiH family protein
MSNSAIKVDFSKISDGNMSFVWGDEADVIKNRQQFLKKLGYNPKDTTIISLEQSNKVNKIRSSLGNVLDKSRMMELTCDGLVATGKHSTLMLIVGDCIPAALYDPVSKQLAIIHAGRKGVELNILSEAVKILGDVDPKEMILISGPAISKESYVFDSEVGVDIDFWGKDFSPGEDGKYHMDIKSKFKSQAIALGLSEENIDISPVDTFASKDYFSHRRSMAKSEPEGRFAIIASIQS